MSAEVSNLQLPLIKVEKISSSTLPDQHKLEVARSVVWKSASHLRHSLDGAGGYKRTLRTGTSRARPLGLLPNYQKVDTWKELSLLLSIPDHSLPQHDKVQGSGHLPTLVVPPSSMALPSSSPEPQKAITSAAKYIQQGIKVEPFLYRRPAKPVMSETGHTEDEEYLDMIAQINMNQYKDEGRNGLSHTMFCSTTQQHHTRKSTKLKW